MKIIEAKNIKKSYPSQLEVLNNVNVDIYEQEFVAIMGPSGSGKSTLLLTLGAMDIIDSGDIIFDGENLKELNEETLANLRRHKMGFVFQQATLLKNLNLLDNIIYPHLTAKNREQLLERAKSLMEKVGIADLQERFMNEVSGGQLQRASICRAVINKPKIIFADEPTGALNSASSMEIMEIFDQLNQEGIAICMVTHDSNVASYAQRILFMIDGVLESELTFENESREKRIERIKNQMDKYTI